MQLQSQSAAFISSRSSWICSLSLPPASCIFSLWCLSSCWCSVIVWILNCCIHHCKDCVLSASMEGWLKRAEGPALRKVEQESCCLLLAVWQNSRSTFFISCRSVYLCSHPLGAEGTAGGNMERLGVELKKPLVLWQFCKSAKAWL